MPTDDKDIFKQRLAELPMVVQKAITSQDIAHQLRELANQEKLHLDQWEVLENEVLMTLFGLTPVEELQKNIEQEVKVPTEVASKLTAAISKIVFEPIRAELERELEHPEAKAAAVSDVDAARTAALQTERQSTTLDPSIASKDLPPPSAPAPVPPPVSAPASTPASIPTPAVTPAPPPTGTISRVPTSSTYKTGEASAMRKNVHDDPYREAPN